VDLRQRRRLRPSGLPLTTLGLGQKRSCERRKGEKENFPFSFQPQIKSQRRSERGQGSRQPPAGLGLDRKVSGGAIIMIGPWKGKRSPQIT